MPGLVFLFVDQQALGGAWLAARHTAAVGQGEAVSYVGGKDSSDFKGGYM